MKKQEIALLTNHKKERLFNEYGVLHRGKILGVIYNILLFEDNHNVKFDRTKPNVFGPYHRYRVA